MGRAREDCRVRCQCQKLEVFAGSVALAHFGYSRVVFFFLFFYGSIFEGVFLWLDVRTPSGKVKNISLRL